MPIYSFQSMIRCLSVERKSKPSISWVPVAKSFPRRALFGYKRGMRAAVVSYHHLFIDFLSSKVCDVARRTRVCVCATFTSMYTQLLINRIKFISLWRITIRLLSEHRLITICFQVFWACTVRIVYCKTVIDQCEGFANALLVD